MTHSPETCPHFLIEAEQFWSVVLEYLTVAPSAAQFVLGHMSQELRHRPLVGRGLEAELGFSDTVD
jgi:hypothetical protein